MKVIYVGSFNPVTKAHKMIADIASEYGDIIFVPVSDYYKKDSLNTKALHRYNMLKLISDKYEISRIEIDSNKQNKTIETLDLLKDFYNDDLILLIGGDNLKDLPNWHKIEELLNKYQILAISRDDNLENIIQNNELLRKYQDKIIIKDDIKIKISSNIVRDKIKNGLNVEKYLDDRVIEYIKRNKLYE